MPIRRAVWRCVATNHGPHPSGLRSRRGAHHWRMLFTLSIRAHFGIFSAIDALTRRLTCEDISILTYDDRPLIPFGGDPYPANKFLQRSPLSSNGDYDEAHFWSSWRLNGGLWRADGPIPPPHCCQRRRWAVPSERTRHRGRLASADIRGSSKPTSRGVSQRETGRHALRSATATQSTPVFKP
jgi:hypothetical protein